MDDVSRYDRVMDLILTQARTRDLPVTADLMCESAVIHLDVDAVAVSVPVEPLRSQTIGAYGAVGRRLEELQVTTGEGPSLDGLAAGATVLIDDLAAPEMQTRWPIFAPAALDLGVESLDVLPMRVGAARFGVLVVYLGRTGGLTPEALAVARSFALIALDLLLEHTLHDVDAQPERRFFDDRPEIHQATGMVSVQLDVDLGTALLRIRARAYADDRLLSELAADVVSRKVRFDDKELT